MLGHEVAGVFEITVFEITVFEITAMRLLSLNLHRRHLTESQRSMVASKIATLKNHRPKGSGSIDLLPESKTQSSAAKQLNVSVPSVKRARVVQEQAVPD